ncbi:GNAT family N-acetyltransferase [Paenibacillus dauci]|uniref:GNAT family N-acetyltransferase n=1 Tax=Paenibacillus dauci TaxID=1567106 RepID=UPI0018CF56B8|nr:GNAT family N-acetyltransferase [Paenibacillus dauci]
MSIDLLSSEQTPPMELLLSADPSPAIIKDYLTRGQCYIARQEQDVIGVYVLLPTRPHTVELVNVAVAESHQNKGIGKQLVQHAIHTAQEQHYHTIEMGTGNSSIHQLALYQKCGFRIVGVDLDFFVRHYEEPIYENGIQCRDMIRLMQDLHSTHRQD